MNTQTKPGASYQVDPAWPGDVLGPDGLTVATFLYRSGATREIANGDLRTSDITRDEAAELAVLFADAGTVRATTGKTPSELAAEVERLAKDRQVTGDGQDDYLIAQQALIDAGHDIRSPACAALYRAYIAGKDEFTELDAKRYRWLRDASRSAADNTPTVYDRRVSYLAERKDRLIDGIELDDAIDAAIQQCEGAGK